MKTRSEEETKTEMIAFKVSKNQKKKIKEMAEKEGKDVSKYIVEKTMHPGGIKPQTIVQVQDIINLATEIALAYAPEKAKEIAKKEKKLWSSWM